MNEITRFDMDMDGSMEPSEHGQWVRYEDAQRTWVDLTDEEVLGLFGKFTAMTGKSWLDLYRMTEAKLKEKNT